MLRDDARCDEMWCDEAGDYDGRGRDGAGNPAPSAS
ncbi:hypothetical protein BVI1335_2380010 [Burkholderia vietnamiensis]|jgi:hypothetical protein|nr:hypothetical protein BVI1335_2380010 [Burkholderia vietnamiensis]